MCDDYFEDDFSSDEYMDETGNEGLPGDDDPIHDETLDESHPDYPHGPDWDDWMIIGPMSEDIVRERRERRRIRREIFGDD